MPPSFSLNIHFYIIFPSAPRSSKWFPSLSCLHQNSAWTFLRHMPVMCPYQTILLELITPTIFGEEYRSWSSSLCSRLHSRVKPSLSYPNTFLSTLFSNTLNLHSSYKNNRQNNSFFLYFNLYIFGHKTERKLILDRTIASILWVQSLLTFHKRNSVRVLPTHSKFDALCKDLLLIYFPLIISWEIAWN